ncbi:MAG: phage holin family protein [Burkholderiaceae bacterium]|jgi:uncharacterized membrane protein YqjE|nr:phage holin family protein [Burkholderiaceae bacterium]
MLKNIVRLACTLLAICQTRLELFSVELREESLRLLRYMMLALLSVFCLVITLLLAILFVVVLFWDSYRMEAIGALAVLFGSGSCLLLLAIRSHFRRNPRIFVYTRAELQKDIRRMQEKKP